MALKGRIPDNKFAGQSTITSVVFGNKCNFVGQNAFRDCISLSKINDDNMIENIQPYAFANCSNLLSVNFNKLSISLYSNAFYGCNNLESVNMPQCINIPINAFANCYNLMYINIPNVTEIGVSAFSSCYNLMSVNIEKNFYKIYPYAFYGCNNLKDINLNKCLSIGERAFDCCSSLNTINLSICNFIGSYAFNECINISQVTLSSCEHICVGAFANCYNLNKVYINNPDSHFCNLDGSHVFCIHDKSTPSLCSINSGITFYFRADVIDKYKKDRYWNYYKDYMMALAQNNQILYTTNDKEPINIDEYNTKPTTTNTAVNKKLTNSNYIIMEFKNKVDNLNYGIFKGSSKLTSIDLPFGCQSIGANEFENCSSLEEFKPSDTLKNIGNYSFKNCKSLSSFTIPESIETLGEGIFAGCENIDTFKGNEKFIKYNGKCLVYNNTLICVLPKDNSDTEGRFYKISNIDANIGRLGKSCFYGCKNMRRVDIPSSVEDIGSGAFEECINLYEIHFERDEPPTIGNGVFNNIHKDFKIFVPESSLSKYNENWPNLKNHIYPKAENDCIIYYGDEELKLNNIQCDYEFVNLDESVINGTYHKLSFKQPIKDIPNYFTGKKSIEKIIIGDNITRIGESAFKNCTDLKYIYLSDMISEFGTECFCNCENLTRIHIPRKLFDDKESNIGDDIFCGCSKLKEFGSYVKGVVSDDNRCFMIANSLKFFAQGDMEASYTIPDNIVDINKSAFRDSKITNIKLSQSTKTIGEHAFDGCTNLTSIENWKGVESIKEYAFMNCINLGEISLPTNLKTIEAHSFNNCKRMYLNGNIPDSIETIGEHAFYECYQFKCIDDSTDDTLNLGNITIINKYTFCGCDLLTKVNINDNIESIEENAFERCSSLTNVKVSNKSNLKSIQAYAFKDCDSLVELYLPASLSYIGSYAFAKCKNYKGGDYQTYKDPETSEMKQKYYLSIPNSLTSIEEYCFSESGIEEIRIQSTNSKLLKILNHSFYKCSNLTDVNISSASNLYNIGSCAFKDCNISDISLSNNIEYIDDEAFMNCNISYIALPEELLYLGNNCFYTYAETLIVDIPTSLKTPPVFRLNGSNSFDSNPFGDPNDVAGLTIYTTNIELQTTYKSNNYWGKYEDYIKSKSVSIQMNINLEEAYLDSEFLNTKYKISEIGNVRWDDTICLYNSIWEKFDSDYKIIQSDTPTKMKFLLDNYTANKFLNSGVQNYSTLNISIPMECIDDNSVKFRIIVSIPNFGNEIKRGITQYTPPEPLSTVMLSMNTHTHYGNDDDNTTTLNYNGEYSDDTITYLMPWTENYDEYDICKMPVPGKIKTIYPSIMYIPLSGSTYDHNISIKLKGEWTSIGGDNEIYNGYPFSILSWAKDYSLTFKYFLELMGMSSNQGVNINITRE